MSRIKQLLQLKKLGLSNRQIAKELKISRDKTNEYVRMAELDSLDIDALLRLDDPVLEKRFHPGNPAYFMNCIGGHSRPASWEKSGRGCRLVRWQRTLD